MRKRFLSFAMAVCMICCITMTACSAAEVPAATSKVDAASATLTSETRPATTFTDVPADAWYAEAINYCQQHGIMSGTSEIARQFDRKDILAGMHISMAKRIVKMMKKSEKGGDILMTGGGALNVDIRKAFEEKLMKDVYVASHP